MKSRFKKSWIATQQSNWQNLWNTYYKEPAIKMETIRDRNHYISALQDIIDADKAVIDRLHANIDTVTKLKNKILWELEE